MFPFSSQEKEHCHVDIKTVSFFFFFLSLSVGIFRTMNEGDLNYYSSDKGKQTIPLSI